MMRATFSTGSPEFDAYLGGIQDGDALLLVQPAPVASRPLLKQLLGPVRDANRPILYLNLSGTWEYLLSGTNLRNLKPPPGTGSKPVTLGRWLKARIREIRRGEILLLDDLSELASRLGGEDAVIPLFAAAAGSARASKGFLVATALRPAFTLSALASLKEASSLCVDMSFHAGDILLTPMQTRNRYHPGAPAPFGFRLRGKGGGSVSRIAPVGDFDAPRGEKIRSDAFAREEIASRIFDGPVGQLPMGLLVADLSGSFIAANRHLRELLAVAETTDQPGFPDPLSFVGREGRRDILRFIARARKFRFGSLDVTARTADARRLPLRVRSMPLPGDLTLFILEDNQANEAAAGRVAGLVKDSRALFADHPTPLCFADRKRIVESNEAFVRLRGLDPDTRRGGTQLSSCFTPKTLRSVREEMDRLLTGGSAAAVRGRFLRSDGTELSVKISVAPAGPGRAGQCAIGVEDVTEYTSRIAALEAADLRYRTITEHLARPLALLRGTEIVYCNPPCVGMFGVQDTEKLRGRSIVDFVPEPERERFGALLAKFIASRQPAQRIDATIGVVGGDHLGVTMWFRKVGGLPDASILLEVEDVTERRKEEERLTGMQEGTALIRSILEAATGTLEYGKLVHIALDRSLEILGWTGGVVFELDDAGRTFTAVYSRHMPKRLLEAISPIPAKEGLGGYVSKTLDSHVYSLDRYPSFLPYRTLFREHQVRRISLIPLIHGDASIGFILGVSPDGPGADPVSVETLTTLGRQLGNAMVNARKLEVVRASERRLHTAVDSLSGVVYTAAPDGTITTIDAAVQGILGYAPREFDRNRSLFLSLIHEEDKKTYLDRVTGSEALGAGFVREYRMRPKARAGFLRMRDSVSVVRGPDGGVTGFIGVLSDVTDEREKFNAAVEESAILRTVHDALPDGIGVFDDGGLCVDWNPTMELVTGTGRTEALGKHARDLAPRPASLGPEGFQAALTARRSARLGLVESPVRPGSWYEAFLVPVPGRGDAGPGFLLRYADVTARTLELEQLLQSEKILLNVINAMDDVMMITDLGGRVVEVNQAFLKVMRYPRSQVVGQEFPYPWLVERDMSRFLVWIARIREQQWLHDFDVTWVARGGAEVQMSLNTTLIRNSMGEPVAMLNIARDISDRVKLTHDVEARNKQIETINRIITLANRSNDFTEIFATVADEIVRLMPASAVFTVSPEGPSDPFLQSAVLDGAPLGTDALRALCDSLCGGEGAGRDGGIIPDLLHDPGFPDAAALEGRIRSAVLAPIGENGSRGAFLVVACREPHAYTDEHAAILRPIARQLDGIIGRLRLFRQVVSDSQAVRGLYELSRKLTSLLDTAEIYRAVLDHVGRVVPCGRCSISILDADTGHLHLVMRMVRNGGGFAVDQLPRDAGAAPTPDVALVLSTRTAHRGPEGGSVVVPMVSEDRSIGVIEILHADRGSLDDVQVRLLENIGYLTAIAVQKAGLYEETVRSSREISQRNRELDDFTYVVSHDLKEPLISIEGFSRILQLDYRDAIGAEGKEYLESMVGATTRMKGLIDDLLMLSRVSRPTESFRPVDLAAVVEEIRGDMEFVIREKKVDFRVDPGLPAVHGSEPQLKILFRNLIGNAVKFNDKPVPAVEIGFRSQENNSYLFWVKDNGIGIEPEYFEKIFVIFQRLHSREAFEGTGAGLAIVKKIIEIHKGRIWVESQQGTGSMFCFTLPAGGDA